MDDERKKHMCGCGLSSAFPFCDGKHTLHNGPGGVLQRCGTPLQAVEAVSREPETANEMPSSSVHGAATAECRRARHQDPCTASERGRKRGPQCAAGAASEGIPVPALGGEEIDVTGVPLRAVATSAA